MNDTVLSQEEYARLKKFETDNKVIKESVKKAMVIVKEIHDATNSPQILNIMEILGKIE